MLNYKELDAKFTQLLSNFSKEDLKAWLEFDKQREMLDRLLNGETVTFHSPAFNPQRVSLVENNHISVPGGNYQYAMAA